MKKYGICITGLAKVSGYVEIEANSLEEAENIYKRDGWQGLPFLYDLGVDFIEKIDKEHTIIEINK